MADFRHVRGLHAYSGGTVPDSNRIPLFSVESERISTALKRLLNSFIEYSLLIRLSRGNRYKMTDYH